MKNKFMERAIELSIDSVNTGGGPFGSVIVKDNLIISQKDQEGISLEEAVESFKTIEW